MDQWKQRHPEPDAFRPESLPSVRDADSSQSVTNQIWAYIKNPTGNWSRKFGMETATPGKGNFRYPIEGAAEKVEPREKNEAPVDGNSMKSVSVSVYEEVRSSRRSMEGRRKTWFEDLVKGRMDDGSDDVGETSSSSLVASDDAVPDLLLPIKRGQTSRAAELRDAKTPLERMELFGGYLGNSISSINQSIDAINNTRLISRNSFFFIIFIPFIIFQSSRDSFPSF